MTDRDSHALCPICSHEYGYHSKDGACQKECCMCGSRCDT